MAVRRKTKRVFRRRKGVRRFRRRRRQRVPRELVPTSRVVRMRYFDTITLNPPAATNAEYFYRANDVFDPDKTGTGHQPMGLDQLLGVFYNHFTVLGSKIHAKFISNSASSGNTCIVGCYLDDDIALITNPLQLLENGKTSYKIMGSLDSNKAVANIRKGFSAKKFFTVSALKGNALYQGDVGSSPTEQAYFHLFATASNQGDAAAFNVVVHIDYIVLLTERRSLGMS